jgi:bla regulator protein BlaR1
MIAEVANHLWHCTLFAIAAALFALLLRWYQAKIRFWVWFAASVKFVIPFAMLMSFGAHTASAPITRAAAGVSWASPTVVRMAQPFGLESEAAPTYRSASSERDWVIVTITAIWLFGSLVIARKRWREWQVIRSALRSSIEAPIQAEIKVRYCPGLLEPSVVGWRQPVLLVPAGIADVLSAAQLRAVLNHEVCHVRRRDNALASFHMLVEFLFWFHPLVWWIGARLIAERERACDEEVLRKGTEPCVYAEGILAVCRHYAHSPLAAASGVTGWSLKKRIEDIMTNHTFRDLGFLRAAGLIATGATILALPFFTGMLNAPLLIAQSTPTPRFESVSVRACRDLPESKRGRGYSSSGGVLNTGCMPLADEQGLGLIQRAYVRPSGSRSSNWPAIVPVKGRPSWFESDLYEVIGKAASTTAQETMEGPMLRAALEDRFRLRIREESADVPVYALMTESGGPKLNAFVEGSCTAMPATFPPPQLPAGRRYCIVRAGSRPPALDAEGASLGEFSKLLSLVLDRPVIDKTGIAGRFAIHLEFAPDASTPRFLAGGELARFATDPARGTLTIARALEHLGLRLELSNGTQRQLVIDHIEKPAVE